jgi:hypothetical protein
MLEGQKVFPASTTKLKSTALWNKRRHRGAIRRGITNTWKVSVLLCRALSNSSNTASAIAVFVSFPSYDTMTLFKPLFR